MQAIEPITAKAIEITPEALILVLEHFSSWYIQCHGSHDERVSRRGSFSPNLQAHGQLTVATKAGR